MFRNIVFKRFKSTRHPNPVRKKLQIAILGADTQVGKYLAFLLKQSPLPTGIHLCGAVECKPLKALELDLNRIDTRSNVHIYDQRAYKRALQMADIIVMLDGERKEKSFARQIVAEAKQVSMFAKLCAEQGPRAILIVASKPVSVMLPIVSLIYQKTAWYNPARLLGSCSLAEIKANTIAGRYTHINPSSVFVPITGGPDIDCALPVFSQTQPFAPMNSKGLMTEFRQNQEQSKFTEAFGLNRMITAVMCGLCEMPNSVCPAFVRSNLTAGCSHICSTIFIGRKGIIHNYGLPKLTKTEFVTFDKILSLLKRREEMGYEFLYPEAEDGEPKFLKEEKHFEYMCKTGVIRS